MERETRERKHDHQGQIYEPGSLSKTIFWKREDVGVRNTGIAREEEWMEIDRRTLKRGKQRTTHQWVHRLVTLLRRCMDGGQNMDEVGAARNGEDDVLRITYDVDLG